MFSWNRGKVSQTLSSGRFRTSSTSKLRRTLMVFSFWIPLVAATAPLDAGGNDTTSTSCSASSAFSVEAKRWLKHTHVCSDLLFHVSLIEVAIKFLHKNRASWPLKHQLCCESNPTLTLVINELLLKCSEVGCSCHRVCSFNAQKK